METQQRSVALGEWEPHVDEMFIGVLDDFHLIQRQRAPRRGESSVEAGWDLLHRIEAVELVG